MTTLGAQSGHDSSIALLDEKGKPVLAVEEERFTRVKLQPGYPKQSIEWALENNEVNELVVSSLPQKKYLIRFAKVVKNSVLHNKSGPGLETVCGIGKSALGFKGSVQSSRYFGGKKESQKFVELAHQRSLPLYFGDHHFDHAASAYYPSGYNNALVVTLDGQGDGESGGIYRGKNGELAKEKGFPYNEKPWGHNYAEVTALLGFNPLKHAGKITGLAAFGKHNPECIEIVEKFLDKVWSNPTKKGFVTNHYY